ncbi:MAG: metallophosphoesterase family protein [Candidatus Hodarchaeales archaeon]
MISFRILTLADIHGNINACTKLVTLLLEKKVIIDLIIIAGDLPATTSLPVMARYMLTHPLKALSKKSYIKWVYKGRGRNFFVQKQIESARAVLHLLEKLKAPIVYITGNVDSKEVLKVITNWKTSQIHFLDSNSVNIDFLTIWGTGGALAIDQAQAPISDHEFTAKDFSKRWVPILTRSSNKFDILVSHEPPAFELWSEGQYLKGGSKSISEVIEKKMPRLVIFGHFHELAIFKRKSNTNYVNPGPLASYHYALIEITKETIKVSHNKLQPSKLDSTKIIYRNRSPINNLHRTLRFV